MMHGQKNVKLGYVSLNNFRYCQYSNLRTYFLQYQFLTRKSRETFFSPSHGPFVIHYMAGSVLWGGITEGESNFSVATNIITCLERERLIYKTHSNTVNT